MSDIRIFHMVDGKTIIGKVTYESSDLVALDRPCEIIILPARTGLNKTDTPQLFFAPYLTIMGALEPLESLDIKPVHILHPRGEAPKGIADGYLQITSGIDLSTSF